MGQYYQALFLAQKVNETDAEVIRSSVHPFSFENGMKLAELTINFAAVLVVREILDQANFMFPWKMI
jgi:hypothetical protein